MESGDRSWLLSGLEGISEYRSSHLHEEGEGERLLRHVSLQPGVDGAARSLLS